MISDGTTITGTLLNVDPLRDLTLIYSDGFYTLDTTSTPKTLVLTQGSSDIIQMNYIFIDYATKTLQVSTSDFPSDQHTKIAVVGLLDAVTTSTVGPLRNQNINDHIKKEGNNGHILHIAERVRQLNASWSDGAEGILAGTPTNVLFQVTSGQVWQMHKQMFPEIDMSNGGDVHVVNDPDLAYRSTSDLNDITEYSDGSS